MVLSCGRESCWSRSNDRDGGGARAQTHALTRIKEEGLFGFCRRDKTPLLFLAVMTGSSVIESASRILLNNP